MFDNLLLDYLQALGGNQSENEAAARERMLAFAGQIIARGPSATANTSTQINQANRGNNFETLPVPNNVDPSVFEETNSQVNENTNENPKTNAKNNDPKGGKRRSRRQKKSKKGSRGKNTRGK
jgi:hypothetical protein